MPRLLYIVTRPITAKHLLRGQLAFMRRNGYDVTVCSSPGPELDLVQTREGVRTVALPMSRELRLAEGPRALARLLRTIREVQPDIVNASTAKAGLLGMIAAATLGVPGRIYLARGLRLEGTSGVLRRGLGVAEIVASRCAHQVVCVSESLRAAYASGGYAPERKLTVIPSNGVDATAFGERERYREQAAAIRAQLGIPADAMVVGFVGRLAADKGIADLLRAFERASHSVSTLHLLVVGGSFAGDDLPPDLAQGLRHPRVRLSGTVEDPAPYYAAMDMLAFPSYREGLPNVPLEAASCELPSIGYRSTGVVDAIAHDCTGVIVDRKDDRAMAEAIVAYARSTELRTRHGLAARARVLRQFTNERVWQQWLDLYRSMPTHS